MNPKHYVVKDATKMVHLSDTTEALTKDFPLVRNSKAIWLSDVILKQ